jgi:hypothetical protein
MIDEHTTNNLRGGSEEVSAVLPIDSLLIDQMNVNVIDEGRGLKRVAGTLSSHVPPGDSPKLFINHRHKPIECGSVPMIPRQQEFCDVALSGTVHKQA